MKIAGIISEYNPFHSGHALHIAKTREFTGDAPVVCVMSGAFVQRGEPAILRKHARAEMALRCGADLVLENPTPWATASAERFALGGVAVLDALGLPAYLSFASECGRIEPLRRAAEAEKAEGTLTDIKSALASGVSFASARDAVVSRLTGDSELLKKPNNLLGVEYLKAIAALGSDIEPVTFLREGAEHDGGVGGGLASASHLRELMQRGGDVSAFVPEAAMPVLMRELEAGRAPICREALEYAVMYRLRTMTAGEYASLPDSGEGLWRRLMEAGRTEPTVEAVLAAVKTKRYALSRIRRMVTAALLGVTGEMQRALPPYIRVLGMTERGMEVLHEAKKTAKLPIITKPAAGKLLLTGEAKIIFETDERAADIAALASPDTEMRRGREDMTTSAVVIP